MPPRRTIEEWATVARVSKETGHIFVEGASDRNIIKTIINIPDNVDVRIAEEIADESQISTPLFGGFKLRIINLADSIKINAKNKNIRCFIDGDFQVFVQTSVRSEALITTDHANLPSETLTKIWLRDFLLRAYNYELTQRNWDQITGIIRIAFVCRYLSAIRVRPCAAPVLSEYIVLRVPNIELDKKRYVMDFFSISNKESVNMLESISEIIATLDVDIRHTSNSNDVFELLYSLLRKSKKIGSSVPREAVRASYLGAFSVNIEELTNLLNVSEWIKEFDSH